ADASAMLASKSDHPNKTGLPDQLKAGIESLSGMSLDHVKVHFNSSQPAQLNALAYAQGTDIHVAPGQERHLPHEAWHVVQQARGGVRPTMTMAGGGPVNNDAGLEQEADAMGAKALSLGQGATKTNEVGGNGFALAQHPLSNVAQRYSTASEGYIWGYGKGTGANAPNFEFQKVSASKIVNKAASTIDYGVDANKSLTTRQRCAFRMID
ncbi:MAG TPA: DUF4157 domain-containing protein, partial [Burkholderiaceae bacterium]|nr:DUF4157 domain-containing protein [Burkholderiaceae bacterium]